MSQQDRIQIFPAFPAALRYPDVDADVLAREAATDEPVEALPWPASLLHVFEGARHRVPRVST